MSSFKTVFAATFIGLALGAGGVYFFLMTDNQRLVTQASLGSTTAQSELAENYFLGKDGFKVNPDKQRYWLERAANDKNTTAQTRLGLLLAFSANPDDVIRGRDLMLDALKTTPEAQKKDTMFMLALSHALVKPINPQRAAGWYQRALAAGSQEAGETFTDIITLQLSTIDQHEALTKVKTRLVEAKTKVEGTFYADDQPTTDK